MAGRYLTWTVGRLAAFLVLILAFVMTGPAPLVWAQSDSTVSSEQSAEEAEEEKSVDLKQLSPWKR